MARSAAPVVAASPLLPQAATGVVDLDELRRLALLDDWLSTAAIAVTDKVRQLMDATTIQSPADWQTFCTSLSGILSSNAHQPCPGLAPMAEPIIVAALAVLKAVGDLLTRDSEAQDLYERMYGHVATTGEMMLAIERLRESADMEVRQPTQALYSIYIRTLERLLRLHIGRGHVHWATDDWRPLGMKMQLEAIASEIETVKEDLMMAFFQTLHEINLVHARRSPPVPVPPSLDFDQYAQKFQDKFAGIGIAAT